MHLWPASLRNQQTHLMKNYCFMVLQFFSIHLINKSGAMAGHVLVLTISCLQDEIIISLHCITGVMTSNSLLDNLIEPSGQDQTVIVLFLTYWSTGCVLHRHFPIRHAHHSDVQGSHTSGSGWRHNILSKTGLSKVAGTTCLERCLHSDFLLTQRMLRRTDCHVQLQ